VGYHVENKTIQLTVKNQPHSSAHDYYYNVRVKGHFGKIWYRLFPSEDSPEMSSSEYTVITFSSSGNDVFRNRDSADFEAPSGGDVDFQVQAFVGYNEYHYDTSALPFSSGWSFETVESGWSETQTLHVEESPQSSPEPAPSPEPISSPQLTPYNEPQPSNKQAILGVAAIAAVFAFGLVLLYRIKRK